MQTISSNQPKKNSNSDNAFLHHFTDFVCSIREQSCSHQSVPRAFCLASPGFFHGSSLPSTEAKQCMFQPVTVLPIHFPQKILVCDCFQTLNLKILVQLAHSFLNKSCLVMIKPLQKNKTNKTINLKVSLMVQYPAPPVCKSCLHKCLTSNCPRCVSVCESV